MSDVPDPALVAFPGAIDYNTLNQHNSEYDAERMLKHRLLYEGGPEFHDKIDKFLVKRQIEKNSAGSGGFNGNAHWEARSEKAWYIPRGAGLIDWLIAEVFKKDIRIVCNDGSEAQKEYWEGLNENADGLGTSLSTICRRALREVLLYKRGYFAVNFVDEFGEAAKEESLEARIRSIPASTVDDWELDGFGKLTMLRTRFNELERTAIWTQPTTQRYCWSFFTDTQIAEYEITGVPKDSEPKGEDNANRTKDDQHDFGVIPIFPVRAEREMWVMARIYDCVIALFNREVSVTWALDQMAYALLVLKLEETEVKSIVASELAALKIKPHEDAKFESPSPKLYQPLFEDTTRLKESLYEVIQMLAQNAIATQTQNARQSADAKELDQEPMQTLLSSFAWTIKEALVNLVKALQAYRNEEDLDVKVQGIDEFDATMADLKDKLAPTDSGAAPGDQQKTETDPEDKSEADATTGGPAALRESKNVGLRDLSRRAGVSPGAISEIEAGKRNPGPQTISKLSQALGVSEGAYQAAVDAVFRK